MADSQLVIFNWSQARLSVTEDIGATFLASGHSEQGRAHLLLKAGIGCGGLWDTLACQNLDSKWWVALAIEGKPEKPVGRGVKTDENTVL